MRPVRALASACAATVLLATSAPAVFADTHDQLRHKRAHAARLDHRAGQQADRLAHLRHRLDRLDARANAALAALQRSRFAADRARAASDRAQQQLARAQTDTATARQRLDDTAAGAYRSLAAGGDLAAALSLVQTGDPQAFLDGMQLLGQVGASESTVIDELRLAEAQQLRVEHLATAAAATAARAERAAQDVRARVDALVARQQRAVARQHDLLGQTRDRAAQAHHQAAALAHRIAVARAKAAAIRRAQAQAAARATGPVPTCNGGSVSGYGNGRLPVGALCPLWGAPGMMLRADAAATFNRMSRAYAQVFGVPLCVTSSYRTYQRQVELYATMPAGYAAVPGTSNHGWGLAVDLCGGIQVDSSPEHLWLLSHAAAYGWFHPSWARPGGPGPHEPWHWEHAG